MRPEARFGPGKKPFPRKFKSALYALTAMLSVQGWSAPVSVIDDFDRTVRLEKPASRIISLAPHNTENLFSAGAGSKVVGVVDFSDFPAEATSIASVGSHVQFNLEAIIDLNPDLVVVWQSGNNAEAIKRIEEFGIPVYYSEPRIFQDIVDNILELASLAGTQENVDPSVTSIADKLEQLKAIYSSRPQLDVFYQIWTDPLMTLNGDHFISRVLELCGAKNIFDALPIIAPQVNLEAVIEANPDAIMTGMVNGQKPDMSRWNKWDSITAVRTNQFVYVDSDVMHRNTLRMLNGIDSVCASLDTVRRALIESGHNF